MKPSIRQEEGLFVVEGVRLIEEALASGWLAQTALFSEALSPRGLAAVEQLRVNGTVVDQVSAHILQSLSNTENSQGVFAIYQMKRLPLPAHVHFVLVADAIRDPGNLGTLLRTAAAAGAQAALLSPGTTDAFSPKVLRAGMGAHFHLPILDLGWDDIRQTLKHQPVPLRVCLADAQAQAPHWEVDFSQPCAILVGSEAEGVGPEGRQLADQLVRIPMPGKTESLNASIAGAILLFEVVRQRALTTHLSI